VAADVAVFLRDSDHLLDDVELLEGLRGDDARRAEQVDLGE